MPRLLRLGWCLLSPGVWYWLVRVRLRRAWVRVGPLLHGGTDSAVDAACAAAHLAIGASIGASVDTAIAASARACVWRRPFPIRSFVCSAAHATIDAAICSAVCSAADAAIDAAVCSAADAAADAAVDAPSRACDC